RRVRPSCGHRDGGLRSGAPPLARLAPLLAARLAAVEDLLAVPRSQVRREGLDARVAEHLDERGLARERGRETPRRLEHQEGVRAEVEEVDVARDLVNAEEVAPDG